MKTKAKKRHVVKNPGWEVRARSCGTKSPSRSEALRFIDSAKSPSTKIDGSMVNFRRRLSNRHGRPRRMLIWTFEGNTDRTVSTSTWFAQVGSSVLIELGQIAGSAKCKIYYTVVPRPTLLLSYNYCILCWRRAKSVTYSLVASPSVWRYLGSVWEWSILKILLYLPGHFWSSSIRHPLSSLRQHHCRREG